MTISVCCGVFDSSPGHAGRLTQEDTSGSTVLKEAGKKLRYQEFAETDHIIEGLETIDKVFTQQTPYCAVLGIHDAAGLVIGVGKKLAKNISRFDPKLMHAFVKESVDVLRILTGTHSTGNSIEIFHSFVASVRLALLSSSGGGNVPSSVDISRGIQVFLPDDMLSTQSAIKALLAILHAILSSPIGLLIRDDDQFILKFGMFLLEANEMFSGKGVVVNHVREIVSQFREDSILGCAAQVYSQVFGLPDFQDMEIAAICRGIAKTDVGEEETQMVETDQTRSELLKQLFGKSIPSAGFEHFEISLSIFPSCQKLVHSIFSDSSFVHLDPKVIGSRLGVNDLVFLLLRSEEKNSSISEILRKYEKYPSLGPTGNPSRRLLTREDIVPFLTLTDDNVSDGLLPAIQENIYREKDSDGLVRLHAFLRMHSLKSWKFFSDFFGFSKSIPTAIMPILLAALIGRRDFESLSILAGEGSLGEMLLPNLDIPVLLSLLREEEVHIFGAAQVFPGYTFPQLVEASLSEVLFRIIQVVVMMHVDHDWGVETVKGVMERAGKILATAGVNFGGQQPVTKRSRTVPGRFASGTHNAIIKENYLHILDLIEDPRACSEDCLRMLHVLLQVVDSGTIQIYAVRTAESISKYSKRNEKLTINIWKIFLKSIYSKPELLISFSSCFAYFGSIGIGELGVEKIASKGLEILIDCHKSLIDITGEELKIFTHTVLDELESSQRVSCNKACVIRLVNDRIVNELNASVAIGKFLAANSSVGSRLVASIIRFASAYDDSRLLSMCGRLVGTFASVIDGMNGSFLRPKSDSQPLSVDTKIWCSNIINHTLLPKIKFNSHAFAVQEILNGNGGNSFLCDAKYFSPENQLVLSPYLNSSYRAANSRVPSPEQMDGGVTTPNQLLEFLRLHVRSPKWSLFFSALKIAASEDIDVCEHALPGIVEVVATEFKESDLHSIYAALTSGFTSMLSDPRNVKIIFSIFDHLNNILGRQKLKTTSKEFRFVQGIVGPKPAVSLPHDRLVTAAISVSDYSRALIFQEQLMVSTMTEDEILKLCDIYESLEDPLGSAGACAVSKSAKKNSRKFEEKISTNDKLMYLNDAVDGGNKRVETLVDGGLYRAAIDAAASTPPSQAAFEACWNLADWGRLDTLTAGDLVNPSNASVDELICHTFKSTKACNPDTNIIDILEKSLEVGMKKISSLNINRKLLTNISITTELDALARAGGPDKMHARWMAQTSLLSAEMKSRILALYLSVSKFFNFSDSEIFKTSLLRHLRKTGNTYHLRMKLHMFEPSRDSTVDSHCEWARGCWAIGDREIARKYLLQLTASKSVVSDSWSAELLLLKWSAELEVLIPRLVVSSYRDLLKRSTHRLKSDREKISFSFANYLDIIGRTSETWNKGNVIRETVYYLIESIRYDTNGKRLLFTINRLLQLHWDLSRGDANEILLSTEIVRMIQTSWTVVPCWVWYLAFPQLISRLTNDTPEMMTLAEQIIVAVVAEYPRQSGWYLGQLLNSRSGDRKLIGQKLLSKINEKSNYPNIQQFLAVIKIILECLVSVARFEVPATGGTGGGMKALSDSKEGSRLLRDTGGLLVMPLREQISSCAVLDRRNGNTTVDSFSNEIRIGKFLDPVYVYNTKAKPKKISISDTNGRQYSFILKLEKKTDLRKDSRVMEFVNVVNHEMMRAGGNRGMRTYSVLILSEDCALIEFVPNLVTMRKIIDDSLVKIGKNVHMYLNKEVMNKLQNKLEGYAYFQSIVEGVSPMISEWMLARFGSDPRLWLRNRNLFTKTQAMWSMVGHVIGLGDRHPDNILIDQELCEIVHVDFDCIFSRGMSLTIPELVPFRLTKICVSGMGITGVEGRFRHECESVLKLMRGKQKTLLSVLHAFIADPLIDWLSSGGAVNPTNATSTASTSYKKARYVIDAIEKKLNGFIDVGEMRVIAPGLQDEKLFIYNEHSDNAKSNGLGKDKGAALSVEGQVDELIKAAICQRNLAKMYLGWMPLF